MPFLMIRNDITKVAADAIVNPANRNLLQGSGTSRAIYQAAGEQELTAACEAIGRCDLGRAVCTPACYTTAKQGTAKPFWKPIGRRSLCTRRRKLPLMNQGCKIRRGTFLFWKTPRRIF